MTRPAGQSGGERLLSSFAMLLLAASPLLYYYYVGASKLSLLALLSFVALGGGVLAGGLRPRLLPRAWWAYWAWCAAQLYLIAGIAAWSDYLPGGILLCIFSLELVVMVRLFDFGKLFACMRALFVVAAALLFTQYVCDLSFGQKLCVLPHLTDDIGGFTWREMLLRHKTMQRFCSIFIEPSYFGQYGLVLLAMELFRAESRDKLLTPFSAFIAATLLVLRSGTGLLGLLALAVTKVAYIIVATRKLKYYLLLAVLLPLTALSVRYYLNSSAGSYVAERTSELDADGDSSSGFVRMFYGWNMFGELDLAGRLVGTSRNRATEAYEKGFSNMATYVATSQGLVGLGLLVFFFVNGCRRRPFVLAAMAISLAVISLIEACYLGGLMLIVAAAVVGSRLKGQDL